jgi:RNA polymerase sigma-70 factor (ECF subfamily)
VRSAARHRAHTVQVEAFDSFPLESHHPTGEGKLLQEEARRKLTAAMRELDPEDRAMLYLHEVEDKGLSELSSMYGMPVGTIKSRLFRARDKLSALLREMGYELS